MDTSKGFGRMSGVEAQMRPERVGDASLIGPIRLFAGVIRRASQRAGLHMFEAHGDSDIAPAIEFRRRDETLNRQTARVRLQVLANGHHVAGNGAQVLHQVNHFIESFAESDHNAALG